MKTFKFIRGAMVALAALGVICPQIRVEAANNKSAKPVVRTVAANSVLDIGLKSGGALTGRVVDHTGAAMEGAEVVVKQGKTEVARTVSDKNGNFAAKNLKGGVYTVSSGATEGTYRVWSENTAAASASEQALLVLGENGARGQFGGIGTGGVLMAGALATSVVLGAVNAAQLNELNDTRKDLNKIKKAISP